MNLSDCNFSDLYVTTESGKPPVIRGLEYHNEAGTFVTTSGVEVPPSFLYPDIKRLFALILKEFQARSVDELAVSFDGVNYRCAQIVAPDGLGKRDLEKPQVWCIRRISKDLMPFEDIAIHPKIRSIVSAYAQQRGLLLVCGSFGSGKTTTASSLFSKWVSDTKEVGVTLEDPPEISMSRMGADGTIFQIDLTERSPEEAIKKLRRWAPRFVMLGEIRTSEAAQELLQISQSGPMTLTTIHAANPVSAITSLVRFAAARMSENDARDLIARTLMGVLYQTMENRKFTARFLSVGDKDNFGVRTKIRLGDFQRIDEVMEQQEKNR